MTRDTRLAPSYAMMDDSLVPDNDDRFDLEAARLRLEAMMGGEDSSNGQAVQERPSSLVDKAMPPSPHLTTIAKARKMAEIQLLSRLEDSDEPLEELWSLWFSERGTKAAAHLLQAEEMTADGPRRWGEAEERLRNLVKEYGVHWAEPVNRLATLFYTQGRLEESKELCETVLSAKPWHFGALSGIVMVCAGLGDAIAAKKWAARRLPPLQPTGSNRRRKEWVERALLDARSALSQAEEQLRLSFGKPGVWPEPPRFTSLQYDDDAWQ